MTGSNASRENAIAEELNWTDRQFDYTLHALDGALALDGHVPAGAGLPANLAALYRDRLSVTQAVVSVDRVKAGNVIPPNIGELPGVKYTDDVVRRSRDDSTTVKSKSALPEVRVGKSGFMGKVVAFGLTQALVLQSAAMKSLVAIHPAFGIVAGLLFYGSKKVGDFFDRPR